MEREIVPEASANSSYIKGFHGGKMYETHEKELKLIMDYCVMWAHESTF